jgi:predicted NUDIX family NTP pyrophosphohydrolase
MPPRTSAGILLFRRPTGGLEILLAHPGGPLFARRDVGAWTIPKGLPDGEADLLAAARREFAEETGHQVADVAREPGRPEIALGSIVQRSGKIVHAWAVEGDLDPRAARSNTFEVEWPPRSGRLVTAPEIDRVGWFPPAVARLKIIAAQAALIDRLEAALRA